MKIGYYELLRSVCQESYWEFVKTFWHTVSREKLVANWHMPYLCEDIQESVMRVINGEPCPHDTVINICPGTSKSTLYSIFLLPWAWTHDPGLKMIGASFTESLAFDLSTKCRQVVSSPLYKALWPHIQIDAGNNNKAQWQNTLLGTRYAVGVGGDVIGKHASIIVVDDALNPAGARSRTDIDRARIWCKETISTRKVNKLTAWTAMVAQRLAPDDPCALFLERDDIKHICLPGVLMDYVKPEECKAFYKDGLFDPNRLNRGTLAKLEQDLGSYGYAGQILQLPVPLAGGMFQVDKITEHPFPPESSEFSKIVRSWDRAATSNGGDWTVGVKMGLHKNGSYWILDVVRGQWSTEKREEVILATAKADGIGVRIGIEREPGSSGIDSAKETVKRLSGFIVQADPVTGDKAIRADTFSVQVNMGNVHIVFGHYVKAYKEELLHFSPICKHDDQVDASSGAFSMLINKKVRLGVLK